MAKKSLTDAQIIKQLQRSKEQNLAAYPFLIPWLIGFIIFTVGPFFYTIYLSFNDVAKTGLGWEINWIGLENYIVALFRNTVFPPALLEFTLMELTFLPIIVILAFILALLLNQKIKFRTGFRLIFFLPVIVLSGSVLDKFLDTQTTSITDISSSIIYLMISNYSQFAADILENLFNNFTLILWFTGIPIILFINGLQKINRSLFEAAKIDGATAWQILWKITIPIIKPTALIVAIFTIVQLGMYSTNPLLSIIRDNMYNLDGGLGLSSAYTWLMSIVTLVFVGLAFWILGDKKDKNDIKLTSVQRAQFEAIKKHREGRK
jgi:oligogalacturonide transport system permease protein